MYLGGEKVFRWFKAFLEEIRRLKMNLAVEVSRTDENLLDIVHFQDGVITGNEFWSDKLPCVVFISSFVELVLILPSTRR